MLFIRKQFHHATAIVFQSMVSGVLSLAVLCGLTGCEKGPEKGQEKREGSDGRAVKAGEVSGGVQRRPDERAMARAKKDFPEFAQEESEFSREFARRSKLLEDSKSVDLENPEWPLVLAREVGRDLDRKREVEVSKARALKEFPELGVSGSEFNSEFVKRAKELESFNAKELKRSDWPYRLAKGVAEEVELKKQVELSKARAMNEFPDLKRAGSELNEEFLKHVKIMQDTGDGTLKNPQWPYQLAVRLERDLNSPSRQYSSRDLMNLKELPQSEMWLKGRVTKVESFLSDGMSGRVVLDGFVVGEFTLSSKGAYAGVTIARKDDGLYMQWKVKGQGASPDRCVYRMGQEVVVKGTVRRLGDGKFGFRIASESF
ncbi:MAG: hypothetical protein WCO60_06285 [Verrucomicrobiota bacterium]